MSNVSSRSGVRVDCWGRRRSILEPSCQDCSSAPFFFSLFCLRFLQGLPIVSKGLEASVQWASQPVCQISQTLICNDQILMAQNVDDIRPFGRQNVDVFQIGGASPHTVFPCDVWLQGTLPTRFFQSWTTVCCLHVIVSLLPSYCMLVASMLDNYAPSHCE
jgi:hypothetical protein